MKSYFSLTMNRTASDTIAAVIKVLTFFLEDSSICYSIRMLIIVIERKSDDKSNVTYNWDSQKGFRKASDHKKGVRESKGLP